MKIIVVIVFLIFSELGWSQTQVVESFFKERHFDSVISVLTKKQIETELSFREYFLLSRSYVRERQYNNGYVLTTEMIAKAKKNNDTVNLLKAFNLKTEHILELSNNAEGVRFCDSITPFYKTRDSLELMSLCFKCGLLYYYNKQHEKAYNTYQKITKKEYRNLSVFTSNFAVILKGLGKNEEALKYLKKSLTIAKSGKKGSRESENIYYFNIADIYIKQQNWELAETYLDSAHSALTKSDRLSVKESLFEKYYTLYISQGRKKEAGNSLDSLFVVYKELLVRRVEEKIYSIEAANSKEDVLIKRARFVDNELEISKDQVLTGTLILLSLVFILIIGVFILKYRSIQSHYKSILTEQQLNWVRLNPEYLSNSFDTMQGMINNNHPKTIVYLSKFSKLLRLILEGSRKSLISLKEETDAIKYYLEIQQLEIENNFTFYIEIDQALEDQEIYIPHMLIQPFVSEAIKKIGINSRNNHTIDIRIVYNNDVLSCVIIDTCGIENKEERSTGNENIDILQKTKDVLKIYTKKLNIPSDVTIESIKTNDTAGAKVSLILPYKNEPL